MTTKKKIYEGAFEPVLIIVMRNDLASMNAGKACAQASHASNSMAKYINRYGTNYMKNSLSRWENQSKGQGFGTCIVLAGPWIEIEHCINEYISDEDSCVAVGKVFDSSYPLRDGSITHEIPLHTCAWFFGDKEDLTTVRNWFELMP